MKQEICSINNIILAYRNTRLGRSKHKEGAIAFNEHETINLQKLRQSLIDGTYVPKGYTRFYAFEPKRRLIFAPQYQDKIVHHAVNNVLHQQLLQNSLLIAMLAYKGEATDRRYVVHKSLCTRPRNCMGRISIL